MDKMKMESANIMDMNIEKIATVFPIFVIETSGGVGNT